MPSHAYSIAVIDVERNTSEGLNCVGMKIGSNLVCCMCKRTYGLHNTGFVVCTHYRNQRNIAPKHIAEHVEMNRTVSIYRDELYRKATLA